MPHLVFELPEILLEIFDSLSDDFGSLLAIIRVNKIFFEYGTRTLWKNAPPIALSDVTQNRRQIYAPKIQFLTFNGREDSLHYSFKDLKFSRLRTVSIDTYRPKAGEDTYLTQYLTRALEEFAFYGGNLNLAILAHLKSSCPRLRRLLIDSPGEDIQPVNFLEFLKAFSKLENVIFLVGMDHLVTHEVILYLAKQQNLKAVSINIVLNEGLIQDITSSITSPFKNLEELRAALPSTAIRPLSQVIQQITRLAITIIDDGQRSLPSIVSFNKLQSIEVTFSQSTRLSRDDLLSLRQLTSLQGLDINIFANDQSSILEAFDFTDNDFDQLVAGFPHLRRLSFQVQCDLSVAVLKSLSNHCTSLEVCELLPIFDIQLLELELKEEPIFPYLQELEVGGFQVPADNQIPVKDVALGVANLIKRHFPRLEDMYLRNNDAFSKHVSDAFDRMSSFETAS